MFNKFLIVLSASFLLILTSCDKRPKVVADEVCIQLPGAPLPSTCPSKT